MVFAIRVQVIIEDTRVAVQERSEPVNCHGAGFWLGALAQCRVTSLIGASKLSRCRINIACRCACPGASFGSICLESRVCKNHDELMNYTVRVMGQALLFVSVPENCLGINSSLFWSKVVQQIVMLPEIILLRREGEKF